MSTMKNEYELAVQGLKATFLDKIYREQGLVSVLTTKLDNYNPGIQEKLKTLLTNQSMAVDKALKLLDEVGLVIKEVEDNGNEINRLTGEQVDISVHPQVEDSSLAFAGLEINDDANERVDSFTDDEGNEFISGDIPPVDEEHVISDVDNVSSENSEETSSLNDAEFVEETPVDGDASTLEFSDTSDSVPESGTEDFAPQMEGFESNNEFVEEAPVGDEGPVTLDDSQTEMTTETNQETEVNSELDVAAEQPQLVLMDDTDLASEESELRRFTRLTQENVRAILVTKPQYEKLIVSKETQKSLVGM